MKKRMIPLTVFLSASLLCLCACGGSSSAKTDDTPEETAETVPEESIEPEEDLALAEPVELSFGVRGMGERYYLYDGLVSPLAEKNVNLEMMGISDVHSLFSYDLFDGPDRLMAQYIFGIDGFDTKFTPIAYTFVTKYNICSASLTSLDELKSGSEIAIPMEYTSGSPFTWRILEILEEAGLIKAKAKDQVQDNGPGLSKYIEENIKGVEFIDTIPSADVRTNRSQFDAVVLDGSYDNVLLEDPTADNPDYWEAIYAHAELLDDPEILKALKMLVDAYHTEKSITYIQMNLPGYEPAGWDVDLLAQY